MPVEIKLTRIGNGYVHTYGCDELVFTSTASKNSLDYVRDVLKREGFSLNPVFETIFELQRENDDLMNHTADLIFEKEQNNVKQASMHFYYNSENGRNQMQERLKRMSIALEGMVVSK